MRLAKQEEHLEKLRNERDRIRAEIRKLRNIINTKKYYLLHREEQLAYGRGWRKKNLKRHKALVARWQRENRERINRRAKMRRLIVKKLPYTKQQERKKILELKQYFKDKEKQDESLK